MPGARLVLQRPIVHQRGFLRSRRHRFVARIEADEDHVEVLARGEREHLRRARDAVHHLRAEHRAAVIDERQDDRPLAAEVVRERHVAAVFILELRVERQRRVEVLLERDVLELRQLRGRKRSRLHHFVARLGEPRFGLGIRPALRVRGNAQCTQRHAQCPTHHCLLFSITRPELESDGKTSTCSARFAVSCGRHVSAPRSSISRIASSIGMWTVPAFLSTQP